MPERGFLPAEKLFKKWLEATVFRRSGFGFEVILAEPQIARCPPTDLTLRACRFAAEVV
jgi:hypothetical protein